MTKAKYRKGAFRGLNIHVEQLEQPTILQKCNAMQEEIDFELFYQRKPTKEERDVILGKHGFITKP